jgi:hypothetical protein
MDKLYIIKMIEESDSKIEDYYRFLLEIEKIIEHDETVNISYFHIVLEKEKKAFSKCKKKLIEFIYRKMIWVIRLVENFEESIDDKYKKELEKFYNTPVIDYNFYKRTRENYKRTIDYIYLEN